VKDLIRQLTEAYGPPGYEHAVCDIIKAHITPYADHVEVDQLGNLHAVKNGQASHTSNGGASGLKIMLAAHMDEIGLIVTSIDDKGFARLSPLGGVHADTMVGNRAIFTNGALGVINIENWLMHDGLDQSHRKLYLDFGVKSKKEAPVRVGDVAGFERPFVDLGEALVAKSMDDRIGCAILIETLRQLEQTPHEVHFVFTVQEEVGTRGATTAAYKVHPDVSIAVDVTDSGDIPERKNVEVKMGLGPAIKVMDRGMLAHPGVKRWMVETATKNKIPYQMEILTLGTTDARAMQLAHEGSAAGALSIPCRYVHTPSEMVSFSDVTNAVKLLLALLAGPAKLEG
jgi:endoglucanase